MLVRRLKWFRIAVALLVFIPLTAALVDFRGSVPPQVGRWLAGIQFIPSSISLVTGAGLSLTAIIILLVTLGAGRIYCSTLCPLGILQDIVIRVRGWFNKNSALTRYAPTQTSLRQTFLWATIGAVILGGGGFALTLLDPYSNFGRIAADIFRPFVAMLNNQLVSVAEALGWRGLYRVDVMWAVIGVLALPVFALVLIVTLSFWRGRLFCNTVCPVGTLLGMVSKRAAFQINIDQSACRKCARCVRVCKSQCIDLRAGQIDFSRCIACYDCMAVCEDSGINYEFAWTQTLSRAPSTPAPEIATSNKVTNRERRTFLAKTLVGISGAVALSPNVFADEGDAESEYQRSSTPITPPGSRGVKEFLDRCTACHLCVSACPTSVLQPATLEYGLLGFLKPHLDFSRSFCNFECRRCSEVCPNGAIRLLDLATKQTIKIGEAEFIRELCVVITNGTDCAACSEHCPTKAVFTKPHGENLRLPEVNAELCIGCGACEHSCPVKPKKAIVVTAWRKHGVAKKLIEPKATLPKSSADFPF